MNRRDLLKRLVALPLAATMPVPVAKPLPDIAAVLQVQGEDGVFREVAGIQRIVIDDFHAHHNRELYDALSERAHRAADEFKRSLDNALLDSVK